ncbi:HEAT repeat domain-containing protein [Candidatus Uabimicrobium sp. HlEnr_7]|uniref:HEAT repeat domain-containing protein n=1 Tax=Candidatus Uabimicrobium helgolandensis TaxID=3095367 RepID=UPI003556FE0C
MKKKQYYYLLITLLCLGCSSSQPQKNDNPKYIYDLSGYVEANKEKYNIGEDIEVKYVIQNNRGKLHQEPVTNGSKKISEAFQSYGFNAASSKDQLVHLEVKDFGKPINGAISLKPKGKKVFVKNIFSSSQPGKYRLTFNLNWKENKQILFKPIVIEVVDNQKPQDNSTSESIDPQIRTSVRNLVDPETREEAEKEIVSYEAKGLIAVVEAMGDNNSELRSEAMFFLIRIKDDYEIDPIRALEWGALHENPEIRMRSIHVAGQIAPDEIIQIIKDRLVNDPDKNVRLTCLRTAKPLTDIIAVQLMVFALNDREVEIRREVIKELKERTNENFGFDPEASEEERKSALQKWREWAVSKYRGK